MPNIFNKPSVYFGIVWWAFRVLGADELNDGNPRSYRYWRAILFNAILTPAFPFLLLMNTLRLERVVDNIMNFNLSLTSVAAIIKYLTYVKQLKKILIIEQLFAELDARMDSDGQRAYHAKLARTVKIISTLYIYTYGAITVYSDFFFFARSERTLPFPAWFPLDWKNSLVNYSIAVLHQMFAISTQVLQNFVDDLFPPLTFLLIAGQCELLLQRLSLIGYDQSDQRTNELKLIECIRDHQKIFRLHELAMEVISWSLLVQFIVIAIDVGAALCALLFFVEDMYDKVYFSTLMMGLCMEIFPICFYGTLVELAFGRVMYGVYCSNWIDQSMAYRRSMIILAERTKRLPKQFAGNLVPIGLTTFLANCKAAYSFCTLIADTGSGK